MAGPLSKEFQDQVDDALIKVFIESSVAIKLHSLEIRNLYYPYKYREKLKEMGDVIDERFCGGITPTYPSGFKGIPDRLVIMVFCKGKTRPKLEQSLASIVSKYKFLESSFFLHQEYLMFKVKVKESHGGAIYLRRYTDGTTERVSGKRFAFTIMSGPHYVDAKNQLGKKTVYI